MVVVGVGRGGWGGGVKGPIPFYSPYDCVE